MSASKTIGIALLLVAVATSGASAQSKRDRSAGLAGNPGPIFGPDVYPPEAMRKGEQGRVVARLSVGADGRVAACAVDQSSGSQSLDSTTCDIALKRLNFAPARDRRGRAVASTYILPVRWVLPTNIPEGAPIGQGSAFVPLDPFDAVVEQVVNGAGESRSCVFRVNGKEQRSDAVCSAAARDVAAAIGRLPADIKGRPFVLYSESRQQYAGMTPPAILAEPGAREIGRVVKRFTIDKDGAVTNCRVQGIDDAARALTRPPCAGMPPFRAVKPNTPAFPIEATWEEVLLVRLLPIQGGV